VNQQLLSYGHLQCNTPIHLVNQQSQEDFKEWKEQWTKNNDVQLLEHIESNGIQYFDFEVSDLTQADKHPRETFMLSLKNRENQYFESGDLLAVRPSNDGEERMYSIGKGANGEVVLYIKRHPRGLCSQFLSEQIVGSLVKGRIISNPKFHVPKRFKSLILISNGTGIAPFMGMINENSHKGDIHLFWGGASKEDYSLYENNLRQMQEEGKITSVNSVFSEEENSYVQDLITKNKGLISKELQRGAHLMICGSLVMEKAVYSSLESICNENQLKDLTYYKSKGRLKTDCY